ncbi:MAG: outer-membrane lipoprotein carrier protein LolA [Muribaculaceae bacterium]|nr:outer-membrane lipoprotein carrier protein LolA [Muribaculaceae bacterium]
MQFKLRYLVSLVCVCITGIYCSAQTALSVLDKAVAKINGAASVNCKFKIENSGNTLDGTFKSTGRKFVLDTPVSKTWYDGKSMWTSNSKSKEITLVNPTQSEVKEVNPFAYMDSFKAKYRVGFSKRKDNESYLVVLNPRNTKDGIKAVEVALNKKTLLPERFIIRDRKDNVTTIYVTALSLKTVNPATIFQCPVSTLKDYELVDLR